MLESGTELITLVHNTDYSPTFVSTDKRLPKGQPTSLGYYQIGATQQYGAAKGPIFKIEFVDISGIGAGSTHVKIWGIDTPDDSTLAPLYPVSYLTSGNGLHSTIPVYLKKFLFCNSSGVMQTPSGAYTVVGYKRKSMQTVW